MAAGLPLLRRFAGAAAVLLWLLSGLSDTFEASLWRLFLPGARASFDSGSGWLLGPAWARVFLGGIAWVGFEVLVGDLLVARSSGNGNALSFVRGDTL